MRMLLLFMLALSALSNWCPMLLAQQDASDDFVRSAGKNFIHNGRPFYFQGSNHCTLAYLRKDGANTEQSVDTELENFARHGVRVVRLWAFCDGDHYTYVPMQHSVGGYHEHALRRLDYTLHAAARHGIKLILVFVNYEPDFGGMDWYVRKLCGPGCDREIFYTDDLVLAAYRNYVAMIINRKNTYTGKLYKDDTTIMAWELANEPHTSDAYERKRGLRVGELVFNWLKQMAAFVKSLDPNHLVSSGEEGYRCDSQSDRHNWVNDGLKGIDFTRNIQQIADLDFATLHIYPDNWGMSYDDRQWVFANFIDDRVRIVFAANDGRGKPVVLEETGYRKSYGDRDRLLAEIYAHANQAQLAGTMVWSLVYGNIDDHGYVFDFSGPGAQAVFAQAAAMNNRRGAVKK